MDQIDENKAAFDRGYAAGKRKSVHVLLQNDAVLGVFTEIADALNEAHAVMKHYGGEWNLVMPGDRMWSSKGRILHISTHNAR